MHVNGELKFSFIDIVLDFFHDGLTVSAARTMFRTMLRVLYDLTFQINSMD